MDEQELIRIYPRLFHMAEDASFDSIRAQGLLSTSALLDRYGIVGQERVLIENRRRPNSVIIRRQGFPDVTIRDNKPMSDSALLKCLGDGLVPSDWYRTLNRKTFFWLHRKRLWRLLRAKAYRSSPHTILTVSTASLVEAHQDRILLSPINSGSTIMSAQPRGNGTFVPIADYPYAERRSKPRPVEDALVELVVTDAVPDIMDHLIAAHRFSDGQLTELWRRKGTAPDDGPFEA
ncbi:hypothetical protein [Mesorhizobium sp. WSM2239]|uniref:Uncharacterized protein n=2 Tax=unclassified Mesorhizobium TaxID=325217 RepID=A0AAU8D5T4_9HYPH